MGLQLGSRSISFSPSYLPEIVTNLEKRRREPIQEVEEVLRDPAANDYDEVIPRITFEGIDMSFTEGLKCLLKYLLDLSPASQRRASLLVDIVWGKE